MKPAVRLVFFTVLFCASLKQIFAEQAVLKLLSGDLSKFTGLSCLTQLSIEAGPDGVNAVSQVDLIVPEKNRMCHPDPDGHNEGPFSGSWSCKEAVFQQYPVSEEGTGATLSTVYYIEDTVCPFRPPDSAFFFIYVLHWSVDGKDIVLKTDKNTEDLEYELVEIARFSVLSGSFLGVQGVRVEPAAVAVQSSDTTLSNLLRVRGWRFWSSNEEVEV